MSVTVEVKWEMRGQIVTWLGGTMADEPKEGISPYPVVDRGDVPELYIDGYQGIVIGNGSIKFNLYSVRLNAELNRAERAVIARLIIPVPVFVAVYNAFGDIMKDLELQNMVQVTGAIESDG